MNLLQQFRQRLWRFSGTRRHLLNAALAYSLGAVALAAGIVTLLVGSRLPPVPPSLLLFAGLAATLLVLAVVGLLRWTRFRSFLDEAFHVEQLAGGLNSRVVSAWDFLKQERRTPLTDRVIEQAWSDLQQRHEARLDREERNRQRGWFVGLLVVFLALGLTPWFSFARVGDNFRRSLNAFLFPLRYEIFPAPGTHVHRLEDKVKVGVNLPGRSDVLVSLVAQENDQETLIPLSRDGDVSSTELERKVETEVRCRFDVGGTRSEEVKLIFTVPPQLVNMQTELVYPVYTRLVSRSLEGVQQRLLALPGTRLTLGFTFSKDLDEAWIIWDGEEAQRLPLEVVGRYATVNLLHRERRAAVLQVKDIHGFSLETPLRIDFDVQNDEKPVVLLPRHLKEDMPLLEESTKLFGFGAQASDDYGITRVVLKWQKTTVDNSTAILDRGEIERLISPVQPKVLISFEKVFATLELKPGDKISFAVEAYDNLAPGQPQVTVSRRCSFFVYQEDLGGLAIKELGLGAGQQPGQERIPKATRATTVKAPEGLRTKENVFNQFEASITTGTRPPTVRGEHGQATRDYFRLLSTVKDQEAQQPTGTTKP